jgi:hypothetical protein
MKTAGSYERRRTRLGQALAVAGVLLATVAGALAAYALVAPSPRAAAGRLQGAAPQAVQGRAPGSAPIVLPTPCAGTWVEVPAPGFPEANSVLNSVGASPSGDVWAVGYYGSGSASYPLSMRWTGTQWDLVAVPTPLYTQTPSPSSELHGVAVASANDVLAGGLYRYFSVSHLLTTRWDGAAWSQVPNPDPGGNYANHVEAVQLVPNGGAWAVGFWRRYSPQALIMAWTGSSWSQVANPVTSSVDWLNGVEAFSPTDAWAVGYGYSPSRSLVTHWDGGSWSLVPEAPDIGTLYDVDGASSGDVWAVGAQGDKALHWDGTSWSIVPVAPGAALYGVQALAADDAWAVGASRIAHWDGAGWNAVNVVVPGTLRSIAAVNANDIWAVGAYYSSTYHAISMHYSCGGPSPTSTATQTAVPTGVPSCCPTSPTVTSSNTTCSAGNYYFGYSFTVNNSCEFPTAGVFTVTMQYGHTPFDTDPWFYWASSQPFARTLQPGSNVLSGTIFMPGPPPAPSYYTYYRARLIGASIDPCWTLDATTGAHFICLIATPTYTATWTAVPTGTPTHTRTLTAAATSTATGTRTGTPAGTVTPPNVTGTPTTGSTSTPVSTGTGTSEPASATPTPTPPACGIDFSDVAASDYFYEPVRYLFCAGVISGYADGTFRPYSNTTRGQIAKIVVLAEGWPLSTAGGPHFSDVPPGSAFYEYVETAYNHRVISGYGDHTFRPGSDVTRGQLTKVIVSARGWVFDTAGGPHFTDVPAGTAFYEYVETAFAHGIISGYAGGTFRPASPATRGQIARIEYNALNEP